MFQNHSIIDVALLFVLDALNYDLSASAADQQPWPVVPSPA